MHDQDLTQGSIPKQLWSLSWPMMLSMFFYTLYNFVDTYWVSEISDEAIAAVSISQISLFVMISLGFGITVGSGVVMAMHIGAKDQVEAERVLGQSFVLSALMAAFFTLLSLIFADQFLTLSGASGEIFEPAKEYFLIVSSGSVLLFLMMAVMFAFNSQGDTTTLTKLFALSTAINIVLDPLLIFGYGPLPAMGISGAATATLVSQSVFLIVAIRKLMSPNRPIRFKFSNLNVKWESVRRVLRIGFPAALTQTIFPMGLAAITYITTLKFMEEGAIAFSLGFRMEFFAYLPAAGFGFGAMALMGQNIGAQNFTRTKEAFNKAVSYAFLSATGIGVLVALFASPLIGVFTDDPTVTEYAQAYMFTVSLSYGFLAALMVIANAFQSIDKSWPGFWIFLLRVVGISIPLAYVFSVVMDFSIWSVWLAIVIGNIVPAAVGYVWIRRKLKELR
ncbi:MATE family efflux transporter [Sanyastnella coralliicola]|uniref:MATE family efflux transporter n=1 Tax=Sanyastnella coralliicola TaxID=3069118 RepID=UPI0027BAB929|nr:MATE family efflux transporter [Longitalea sp. SCSIO 12813]